MVNALVAHASVETGPAEVQRLLQEHRVAAGVDVRQVAQRAAAGDITRLVAVTEQAAERTDTLMAQQQFGLGALEIVVVGPGGTQPFARSVVQLRNTQFGALEPRRRITQQGFQCVAFLLDHYAHRQCVGVVGTERQVLHREPGTPYSLSLASMLTPT